LIVKLLKSRNNLLKSRKSKMNLDFSILVSLLTLLSLESLEIYE
jgi:hypothetical protein